jgi:hypothetical protein
MNKIGRNEPCHCGSGKKYKNCHQKIEVQKGSRNRGLIMGAIIIVLIIISGLTIFFKYNNKNGAPGPAPKGQVWSPEHGHFHNIN